MTLYASPDTHDAGAPTRPGADEDPLVKYVVATAAAVRRAEVLVVRDRLLTARRGLATVGLVCALLHDNAEASEQQLDAFAFGSQMAEHACAELDRVLDAEEVARLREDLALVRLLRERAAVAVTDPDGHPVLDTLVRLADAVQDLTAPLARNPLVTLALRAAAEYARAASWQIWIRFGGPTAW
ncbi:hypothetical protein [Longimycelium tulufanense]|nr:hypothetical protein [Longimycelium tulufanense]